MLKTPSILWHDKNPILSVHFQPIINQNAQPSKPEPSASAISAPSDQMQVEGGTSSSGKKWIRLASGGADSRVNIWRFENGKFSILAELTRHLHSVNCVRWSPSGKYLASGSDDGCIIVWSLSAAPAAPAFGEERDFENIENWVPFLTLRGGLTDVYDLAWRPDEQQLVSVGTDKITIVWEIPSGNSQMIKDHSHYIQGVAFDPRGQMFATQSSDRTLRIYQKSKKEYRIKHTVSKRTTSASSEPTSLPDPLSGNAPSSSVSDSKENTPNPAAQNQSENPTNNSSSINSSSNNSSSINSSSNNSSSINSSSINSLDNSTKGVKSSNNCTNSSNNPSNNDKKKMMTHWLFADETIQSFFRRLDWSPDGQLLVAPAGVFQRDPANPAVPVAFAFARNAPTRPVFYLPAASTTPFVVARFNPVCWEHFSSKKNQCERLLQANPSNNNNNLNSQKKGMKGVHTPLVVLPYRMVLACATSDTVYVYDTSVSHPIAVYSGIHYAIITDLTWDRSGSVLVVSSKDGFCSFIDFADKFGTPYERQE